MTGKIYLGDGVYASMESGMILLETDRGEGRHFIYLDDQVFDAMLRFAEKAWNVKVSVTQPAEQEEE